MIYLGQIQTLTVIRQTPQGLYLSSEGRTQEFDYPDEAQKKLAEIDTDHILLPRKEAKSGDSIGQKYEVFVYKDSEDRPIATTILPPLTLYKTALLTVTDINKVGAFLNWNLIKDLFLPFKEQTYKVETGDEVLVSLYIDKSSRLCATMKVYPFLETGSGYEKGSEVTGLVYETIDNFGAFVAVDNKYQALLPKHRLFDTVTAGTIIKAHVEKVQPDGKLELATRESRYLQTDPDSEVIYQKLVNNGGYLPYHDKSDPDLIKEVFHMSKAAFKRAIGSLYKAKKIVILEDGIRIVKS